ncbi:4-hydroxyphenylacetate 3-hydroxylase N-terminal domain-containing protein [Cohnella massiliensis]|uniref:4-hydroxyphenylacetate 3-hydroxylase N-terminal domain-containing protein n=1 Tax=Cohnella massiliensis TaxID=1816691 RepID=UPI001FEB822F|nr:4-hydroxyphenylacetate 3-hydroxylase N-terminal domain-containing protein [Cohnella massiliensis]
MTEPGVLPPEAVKILQGETIVMLNVLDRTSRSVCSTALSGVYAVDGNTVRFAMDARSEFVGRLREAPRLSLHFICDGAMRIAAGRAKVEAANVGAASARPAWIEMKIEEVREAVFHGGRVMFHPEFAGDRGTEPINVYATQRTRWNGKESERMVRSGKQYVDSLRDSRTIYIGGEKVKDVTTHPAFAGIVNTFAGLYDMAADPANGMTYTTEDGTEANKIFMIPRSREDLAERRASLMKWAEATCGFVGRSPDHVAGFLAGFVSAPEVFGERYENVKKFYTYARDNDQFVTYVIIPPQIDRSKAAHEQEEKFLPVGVCEEREDGIVVRGSQMLGTSAAVSNYLFCSCITPLRPGDEEYAVSFGLPMDAPGLKLYARPSFAADKPSVYDYPLSTQFDESDALVVFDDVFIPWEHVFVYRDIEATRAQFHGTPAHVMGNNQAQIRLTAKMKFLIGVARKVTMMNGSDKFPQVQERLGELASLAAQVEGMLKASEYDCVIDKNGVARPNARYLYAVVGMQDTLYASVIKILRELVGGGVLQVPSSYKEMIAPETRDDIRRYIRSPGAPSEERIRLFKLAWDIIGSEFGGRHQQYEMFYNGAPFVVKGYAFRNYGYDEAVGLVDRFLGSYSLPEA